MKNTYFIADAHLGSWAIANGREQEKRLVRFLESIRHDAHALYMLGDIFDFWHEYKYTVPKGYTRLLGKLSELSDSGMEIHFLTGNHDLWMHDYLRKECGITIHKEKLLPVVIDGKRFCLAHGDGLDKSDRGYLALRYIFHNRICQRLFASIHPRWAMKMGYSWAKHSRIKHQSQEGIAIAEDKDHTMAFARKYIHDNPGTAYFIIGHRHIDLDKEFDNGSRFIVLGDWITKFSVAVFDGSKLTVSHFDD